MKIDKNSHLPRYYQLKEIIKDGMAMRKLDPGKKIDTVRATMAKYNVSCDTVRKAVAELITEGILTAEKGKGLYVREAVKKRLPVNIVYMISEDVPQLFQNQFHGDILWGVREESAKQKYNLSLSSFSFKKSALPKVINEYRINAVIISGMAEGGVNPDFLTRLRQNNLSIIWVDYRLQDKNSDYIVSDYRGGLSKLTEYLIGRGHKKITYIDVDLSHPLMPDRLKGYKDAMAGSGLEPDVAVIKNFTYEEGINIGQAILGRPKLPTAIIGFNDNVAIGVMKAIASKKLRIPQDIAVAGVDDFPIASQISPALTTVRINRKAMGAAAVKLFSERLKGNLAEKSNEVVIPTELIVRESA